MLALDLVEDQRGLQIIALSQPVVAGIVERVDVAGDVARVGAAIAVAAAEHGAAGEQDGGGGERKDERAGNLEHGGLLSEGFGGGQAASPESAGRMNGSLMSGAINPPRTAFC